MNPFSIERLQPIGGGFWKAEVLARSSEVVEGRTFGKASLLTFRFKYNPNDSVRGLLECALAEARRCQSTSSDVLEAADLSADLGQPE